MRVAMTKEEASPSLSLAKRERLMKSTSEEEFLTAPKSARLMAREQYIRNTELILPKALMRGLEMKRAQQ